MRVTRECSRANTRPPRSAFRIEQHFPSLRRWGQAESFGDIPKFEVVHQQHFRDAASANNAPRPRLKTKTDVESTQAPAQQLLLPRDKSSVEVGELGIYLFVGRDSGLAQVLSCVLVDDLGFLERNRKHCGAYFELARPPNDFRVIPLPHRNLPRDFNR